MDARIQIDTDEYYRFAPYSGGRVVDRVVVGRKLQPWVSKSLRQVSRRWLGPLHVSAQGINMSFRYAGIHNHIGRGMYPMHSHPHSEFILTLGGRGEIHIPNRKAIEVCDTGHLVVLPPSCIHQTQWNVAKIQNPWRVLVVNFDMNFEVAQTLDDSSGLMDLAFSPFQEWFFIREGSGIKPEGALYKAIIGIAAEIENSLTTKEYGICSEIVTGLIRIISMYSRHIKDSGRADGTHLASPTISKGATMLKARSLMENAGYIDPGCVTRVAESIGMSGSHFIREFKRLYGVTPKQFSLEILMNKAAALMKKSDISIKNASAQLGFSNSSSFSRAFTQYFGVSAKKFQNSAKSPDKHT